MTEEPVAHTTTQTEEDNSGPPLWKQLFGAVVGGTLALGLYYGYEWGKPVLTGYLFIHEPEGGRMYDIGAANIADKSLEADERKRVIARNQRAAAGANGQTQLDSETLAAIDEGIYDIAWPGSADDLPGNITDKIDVWEEVAEAGAAADADMAMQAEMNEPPSPFSVQDITATDMATSPMDVDMDMVNDPWADLWTDIRSTESVEATVIKSNAETLPDSGFGTSLVLGSSLMGAGWVRYRKRFKKLLRS